MAQVSSRYARAFVDVIFERKLDAAKSIADLEQFAALATDNGDLRNALHSPAVPLAQKVKVLDAIVGKMGASRELRNFLATLAEKRRTALIGEIAALAKNEVNERLGMAEAEVTTARELSAEERSALEGQLSRATGKRVRAQYAQDPALLGGALVRIGSTVYDGTVKGRLQRMKAQMASQ